MNPDAKFTTQLIKDHCSPSTRRKNPWSFFSSICIAFCTMSARLGSPPMSASRSPSKFMWLYSNKPAQYVPLQCHWRRRDIAVNNVKQRETTWNNVKTTKVKKTLIYWKWNVLAWRKYLFYSVSYSLTNSIFCQSNDVICVLSICWQAFMKFLYLFACGCIWHSRVANEKGCTRQHAVSSHALSCPHIVWRK